MTTTITFGDTTDGYIQSINANYTTMRNGSSLSVDTVADNAWWGQNNNAGSYSGFQLFFGFTYTVPTAETITAAYIRVRSNTNLNTGVSRTLTFVEFDWGTSLTTADWRTTAQIAAITTQLANIQNAEDAGSKLMMAGSDSLISRLASAGPLRVMAASDRFRNGTTPTVDEGSNLLTSDYSGTSNDPALIFTSVPQSRLFGVLGAQVQLSDGTHAYLESSGVEGIATTISLKHHNGTSASTIDTLIAGVGPDTGFNAGTSTSRGMQQYALVVDALDNLYVVGPHKGSVVLGAVAYTKGVGYTWTEGTYFTASLPSYTEGVLNNFAGAWHNVGTNGTIMVVASHTAGRTPNTTGDTVFALLNCQSLLAGSGTLLRASGSTRNVVTAYLGDSSYYTDYVNETGSMLDVCAAPGANDRGYVWTTKPYTQAGVNDTLNCYRYVLNSGGTGFASSGASGLVNLGGGGVWGEKDASAKARVVGMDSSVFAIIAVDDDSGYGISMKVVQNIGTSTTYNVLGTILLDGAVPSMPSAVTLSTSSAWDAIYDPSGEKLWIYYTDTADSNRLMRTSIDMNTYLAAGDEVEVDAAIGAAGSTTHAIRVHRGETQGQQVLVTCASETSGGTHSTVYVTDTLNQAPNAPTLTPKANFDATAAATFNWTFSDPNAGDTQSAYEFEVVDVSDSSLDIDTGKVVSTTSSRTVTGGTLTNGKSYQWRVKTWDQLDAEGAFSGYGTFSTSAGGTVTITDPATDNPANVITDNYVITWSVSGTTQQDYRVKLIRTDTSATLSDTGWVTSTATSLDVTGMISDVQHRIEVTVRNSLLVESGTGTRLITPSFSTPEKPTFTTTVMTDHILISVTNPTPTGDKPEVIENQILRRVNGSSDNYSLVGTTTVDGTFKDYTAASGTTYQYIVRGVA